MDDRSLRARAGKLRHLATIEAPTRTQTASGQMTLSWSEVSSVYVQAQRLSGRDLWNAQQVQPDATHEVTSRYVPGVTADMRIKLGERTLNIASPPEDVGERRILLKMLCIEAG